MLCYLRYAPLVVSYADMSAEIYKFGDSYEGADPAPIELGEKGLYRKEGYGDGQGMTTFVNVEEGGVQIFDGKVTATDESSQPVTVRITRERIITVLGAGESYVGQIMTEGGDFLIINVRNIGRAATDPDIQPAWN